MTYQNNIFIKYLLLLWLIFNFALPKGGFDINDNPITWGYIITFILIGYVLFKEFTNFKILKIRAYTSVLLLPFIFYFIFFLLYVDQFQSIGFLISSIISFIIFPIIFILYFNNINRYIFFNFSYYHDVILNIVLFVSIYGIILFVYKIFNGSDLEIPYITVNIKDYGLIDSKSNNRGDGIFKLISTYNNGNIFGLCMLFLLAFVDNYKLHKILLKLAMILTLSRTVWFGLIVYELIYYRKHILKLITYIIILITGIFLTLVFVLDKKIEFLIDPTLGGRLSGERINISFFFFDKTFIGLSEMIYKSIVEQMGILGLIFFVMFLFSGLIMNFVFKNDKLNIYQQKLKISIIAYLFAAFFDGAFLYIPVSLFFWFFNSLLITDSNKLYPIDLKNV